MKREPGDLAKVRKRISAVYILGLLAYSILSIVLIITAYIDVGDLDDTELSEIVANWQTKTIIDLVVSDSCPSDYELALQGRHWPGTKSGCWCGNISQELIQNNGISCNPYCENQCTDGLRNLGCQDVAAKDSQLLNTWAFVENTSKKICVKRSSETWADFVMNGSKDCSSGTRKCGVSTENIFCTKESQCPINMISVIDAISMESEDDCDESSNCIQLKNSDGASKRLVFARGSTFDALPLVQFDLNEYAMCNSRQKNNFTPGRKSFPLLKEQPSTCYDTGAKKWNTTDQISEAQLFEANGLSEYMTYLNEFSDEDFKGYYAAEKTGDDYTWSLFSRNYIPWKIECRDQMQVLIEKSHLVPLIRRTQLSLLIIGTISTLCLAIIVPCLEIYKVRKSFKNKSNVYSVDMANKRKLKNIDEFKKSTNLFIKVLQIPIQIWAIVSATYLKGLYTTIITENCSNEETQAVFSILNQSMGSVQWKNCTVFAILIVSLLVDILLSFLKKKAKVSCEKTSPECKEEHIQLTNSNVEKKPQESP